MWKAFVVLFVLALSAQQVAAHDTVQVTASALNVRTGPSTGYSIIGKVYSGQKYVQIATSGSWRKIWFSNVTGWVHGSYVTTVTATHQEDGPSWREGWPEHADKELVLFSDELQAALPKFSPESLTRVREKLVDELDALAPPTSS